MRRTTRPAMPEQLESRLVLSTVALQGTLKGYLDNPTAIGPGAVAADNVSYHMHVLGSLNGLGTAFGGGVATNESARPDLLVRNQLLTIEVDAGSVTVQLNEVEDTSPFGTAPSGPGSPTASYDGVSGPVATYNILGGTGAYAGASGQGNGLLSLGADIQLPDSAEGETSPTFTLLFLQPTALAGKLDGTASTLVFGSSDASTADRALTTFNGTGTLAPIGSAGFSGSISAAVAEPNVGYSGAILLGGSDGSITIQLDGELNLPILETQTVGQEIERGPLVSKSFPEGFPLNYHVISGTGNYHDLVDNGTVEVSLTGLPDSGTTSGSYSGTFTLTFASSSANS